MSRLFVVLAASLLGTVAATAWLPAQAQDDAQGNFIRGPNFGENGAYGSPTADGRPGVYFFNLGFQAFKKGDYKHAIDMYKVAASWAYKPAQYDLGLMYFRGQGVPVDRPRGAAWMILAAERNTPLYVKARDVMVTMLTKAQFQRTDDIWNQLKPTYGDAVALVRAKARWIRVGRSATGTRVGHSMDNLRVIMVLAGYSEDGSLAYHEFDESNNPYSPIFLKNRTGMTTVGPLQEIKSDSDKQPPRKARNAPPSSTAAQPHGIP